MTDSPIVAPAAPAEGEHPWAELPLEQPTLLRLAPLPGVAGLGQRPLRLVELVQAERHDPRHSLLRLVVRIPGSLALAGHNTLEVWLDHDTRLLRFGPASGLHLDLPGRGLGRFLFARGIAWARQRWPHYRLHPQALPPSSASGIGLVLHDALLQTQGLDVVGATLDGLNPDWNPDKVQILPLPEAALMLEQANRQLLEQDGQLVQFRQRLARQQQEEGVLRFGLFCLVGFALFQAGLLIWMAMR